MGFELTPNKHPLNMGAGTSPLGNAAPQEVISVDFFKLHYIKSYIHEYISPVLTILAKK